MQIPRQSLIVLFILFFATPVFSQIVIKDTVVIAPEGPSTQSSLTSNPQYYLLTVSLSSDALNSLRACFAICASRPGRTLGDCKIKHRSGGVSSINNRGG